MGIVKAGAHKAALKVHPFIPGAQQRQHIPKGAAGQYLAVFHHKGLLQGKPSRIYFAVVIKCFLQLQFLPFSDAFAF